MDNYFRFHSKANPGVPSYYAFFYADSKVDNQAIFAIAKDIQGIYGVTLTYSSLNQARPFLFVQCSSKPGLDDLLGTVPDLEFCAAYKGSKTNQSSVYRNVPTTLKETLHHKTRTHLTTTGITLTNRGNGGSLIIWDHPSTFKDNQIEADEFEKRQGGSIKTPPVPGLSLPSKEHALVVCAAAAGLVSGPSTASELTLLEASMDPFGTLDLIESIVVTGQATVVNISFQYLFDDRRLIDILNARIEQLVEIFMGRLVFVCSSGNSSSDLCSLIEPNNVRSVCEKCMIWPGFAMGQSAPLLPYILTGSANYANEKHSELAPQSNHGPCISAIQYGHNIPIYNAYTKKYELFSGTSFAAAKVAAIMLIIMNSKKGINREQALQIMNGNETHVKGLANTQNSSIAMIPVHLATGHDDVTIETKSTETEPWVTGLIVGIPVALLLALLIYDLHAHYKRKK